MPSEIRLYGLDGIPEVRPGDDLAGTILKAVATSGEALRDGDLLVVTHKIVSKSEGQIVDLREITPSDFAIRHAVRLGEVCMFAAELNEAAQRVELLDDLYAAPVSRSQTRPSGVNTSSPCRT